MLRDFLLALTAIGIYVALSSMFNVNDFTSFKDSPLELTRNRITINTAFVTPEEIAVLYEETGNKAKNVLAFSIPLDDKECLIYSVTPDGWDDHRSLAMLGHEVLHCLGGQHK